MRLSRSIALLLMLMPVAASAAPFPDMENSWFGYQENVEYLMEKGSINGYPDGLFRPKNTVNRAEFLKLVFRSKGEVAPVADDCFDDVPADAWFAAFVCAAKHRNIVEGYRIGTGSFFKPEQPIVFAEAVKMVVLAYGADIVAIPGEQWYSPYVQELEQQNILRQSSYIPWDPITRERAADLIARFVRHQDRERVNVSAGCGKTPVDPALSVNVNGIDRPYLLTKPPPSDSPAPLIVAFHGRTNSNEQVRNYFGLDREARGYFIAYPSGLSNGNGAYSYSDPGNKQSELRDYKMFDAIVKQLGESYCIDMDRIFVVGHSLGAWFANSVACARGGIVRASATVGGSPTRTNCTGPVAAMIINNPKDASSWHKGVELMRDHLLVTNACENRSHQVEPSTLSCVQYESCPLNPVIFCPHTIDNDRNGFYPHLWPPGTAKAIVDFFEGL